MREDLSVGSYSSSSRTKMNYLAFLDWTCIECQRNVIVQRTLSHKGRDILYNQWVLLGYISGELVKHCLELNSKARSGVSGKAQKI